MKKNLLQKLQIILAKIKKIFLRGSIMVDQNHPDGLD